MSNTKYKPGQKVLLTKIASDYDPTLKENTRGTILQCITKRIMVRRDKYHIQINDSKKIYSLYTDEFKIDKVIPEKENIYTQY